MKGIKSARAKEHYDSPARWNGQMINKGRPYFSNAFDTRNQISIGSAKLDDC